MLPEQKRTRFLGRHKHNIDGKGRISIPAEFREILASLNVRQLIITNDEHCLDVYTSEQWDSIMDWIESFPSFMEEAERFRQFYISAAQLVEIDKQGRILIPPTLREEVGLTKEIMIMGDGSKIQIWNKETWDQINQDNKFSLREIKNKLASNTER